MLYRGRTPDQRLQAAGGAPISLVTMPHVEGESLRARIVHKRGVALLPVGRDRELGAYSQLQLVRIHLLAGEKERAVDLLEPLLAVPWALTPAWLRIDPRFAPLRGNARFERLTTVSR